MSHPAFFNEYKWIYGLTGTIGCEAERKEVQNIYKIDSFDVPPHFPNLRKTMPMMIVKREDHFNVLLKEIQDILAARRPVLVLFKTIEESTKFSTFLIQNNLRHLVLNEIQK